MLPMLAAQATPIEIDFRPRAGLFMRAQGIELVKGSFIQYYQPGWVKGYYSTNWNDQTVTKVGQNTVVRFDSTDGRVKGEIVFEPVAGGVDAHYTLGWNSAEPANVEVSFAHLWAAAFEAGVVKVDGVTQRSPSIKLAAGSDPKTRRFGGEGMEFRYQAPFGELTANLVGTKGYVFDARGYTGDFSQGKELFWFGVSDLATSPGAPAKFSVQWRFQAAPMPVASGPKTVKTVSTALPDARVPRTRPLPMVPLPKSVTSGTGEPFRWSNPATMRLTEVWQTPLTVLNSRFSFGGYRARNTSWPSVEQKNLGLPAGGYTLEAKHGKLSVIGQDREGIRNGLVRAVGLTYAKNGAFQIDPVSIRDWPSNGWRGLHMFVGPRAEEFQRRMATNLLAPMMFNQVVLQCERTAWDSTPGIATNITMSKAQLAALFEMYREFHIEPTPLIQSFGHMEWLFANGKNLDIALNPKVPYAIDPNNPKALAKMEAIWKEAIALLNPQILHFGLDEVDMRGFPGDDKLVTQLWRKHVPWLAQLAKDHRREMMIWGDQMLAPAEAPDAALGHNKVEAAARREVVPEGTWIADWHYINNADPKIYKSLALFRSLGLKPVATSWNRPENIKGFFKAAESEGGAVLQSTWAGYESTESNMLRESSQFVAYLLAGEYAWSGRPELAKDLPYQPMALFQELMYGGRSSANLTPGRSIHWAPRKQKSQVGFTTFELQEPLSLYYPLSALGAKEPREITLDLRETKAATLELLIEARTQLDEMSEVAMVTLVGVDGTIQTETIRYGQHVRANREGKSAMMSPSRHGRSAVKIVRNGTSPLKSVRIESKNPTAGLSVHGVTVY